MVDVLMKKVGKLEKKLKMDDLISKPVNTPAVTAVNESKST